MKTSCHSRGLVENIKKGLEHLTEFNKKLGGLFWLKCGAALLQGRAWTLLYSEPLSQKHWVLFPDSFQAYCVIPWIRVSQGPAAHP